MNANLKQQLKKYSALSAGLISCASINAAVQPGNLDKIIENMLYFNSIDDYSIDLDGNGVVDFVIGDGRNASMYCPIPLANFYGLSPYIYGINGEVIGNGSISNIDTYCGWVKKQHGASPASILYVSQINSGASINSLQNFSKYTRLCNNVAISAYPYSVSYGRYGNWSADTQTNFIGVRFNIGANTHYGWIRLTVDNINHRLTIHDYAYEDTPDTPINAGQMFIAPPPAESLLATYSSSQLITSFSASPSEEATEEYRLFVVKDGTTFGLTEAESNTNFVSISPDGSETYAHYYDATAPDSDGDIFTKSNKEKAHFLDTDGQPMVAGQNYRFHILNIAKNPIAEENSMSTPSDMFTVENTVSIEENQSEFEVITSDNQMKVAINSNLIGANIEVIDMLGKKHLSQKLTNSNSTFELNVPQGVYIVIIRKDDFVSSKKALIK